MTQARCMQLIWLLVAVVVGAGCATPTATSSGGEANEVTEASAGDVEVTGEEADEVVEVVAGHAPAGDATVAQRLVALAAQPGDYQDTLPVGWRVTKQPGEEVYRARFVWDASSDAPEQHRFDFVVSSGSVEPANEAARELLAQAMEPPDDDLVVIPPTYDTERGEWVESGVESRETRRGGRRLNALAAVLDQPWLSDRLAVWMTAQSIHAEALEACSTAKNCFWRVDAMNDEWMRVQYVSDIDGMPESVVWHVSGDRVLARSPLAYLLATAGDSTTFEVPADRPLRARLTSDAFHFEGRWLTDVREGSKGGSKGVFAARERWRDEVRLAVLLSRSHGVDGPTLELEVDPDERAFVLGLFTGIAYEQGVGEVRFGAADAPMVVLPKMRHEDAAELDSEALAVTVKAGAFGLSRGGESIEPLDDCPDDGPTVCARGSKSGAERYDLRRFYNAAFDARSDSNSRAIVGFDNDVPAGVMFEVLR
ncbi:MAG: hypothetical protein ACQEVA_06705, partial [Myxococcota bacterium]